MIVGNVVQESDGGTNSAMRSSGVFVLANLSCPVAMKIICMIFEAVIKRA